MPKTTAENMSQVLSLADMDFAFDFVWRRSDGMKTPEGVSDVPF